MRKLIAFAIVGLSFISLVNAQDTTLVQCLTFDDVTKRRDTYLFPPKSEEYRKILMKYTLKCDKQTTADNYQCGEWDYLTYTYLYNHDGEMDSTYKSGNLYLLGSTSPASIPLIQTPIYQFQSGYLVNRAIDSIQSAKTSQVGNGTMSINDVFNLQSKTSRAQYLWKGSELMANGVDSGAIEGIQLDFSQVGGTIKDLKIKLAHTSKDSLLGFEANLNEHYHFSPSSINSGWGEFVFLTPFYWDGSSNIVVEFSYTLSAAGQPTVVRGSASGFKSSITSSGKDYAIELDKNGSYLNLGSYPTLQGAANRSIEIWSKVESFNNAGLFEVGTYGSIGKDFSLRTSTTDNQFRIQHWGTPDYDATVSNAKDKWNHYAVVYNGTHSRFYYNGKFAKQEASSLNTGLQDFWVGRWGGSYLDGKVSDFRVWDVALTDQEIAANFNQPIESSNALYANLLADYRFDEGLGVELGNTKDALDPGAFVGSPAWYRLKGDESYFEPTVSLNRPNIKFVQGQIASHLDSTMVVDSVALSQSLIQVYDNPSGIKLADGAVNHPSSQSATVAAWLANKWIYDVDKFTGATIDSHYVAADTVLINKTINWFSTTVRYEIGRFITPYGIGLTLGPDGFTWYYDVTDYAPILFDNVDISSGNQQELIDIQFIMIKGAPARKVKNINRVWGQSASYRFKDMADNTILEPTSIDVVEGTESYKMLARLTGHGHNSNTGNYPHCCEWRDNEHYFSVDGTLRDTWHIWQTRDCAQNPVFPQGGTWPGSREGWCPGDVVKDHEIELTEFVTGPTVELDYNISGVPQTNLGMGNGNYVTAMHFFQYEPAAYQLDAEVYEVFSPSNNAYHQRKQLICESPLVTIRNAGATELTSVDVYYNVLGGHPKLFKWTGSLKFMETETIELPFAFEGYFTGDGSNQFTVYTINPNGGIDENIDNDRYTSSFEAPARFENDLLLNLRSNNVPADNYIEVRDISGNIMFSKYSMAANTQYRDTLDLDPGCYVLNLVDKSNDGLSYWANTAQGTGSFSIMGLDSAGKFDGIVAFEPEFGYELTYSFTVGTKLGNFNKPVSLREGRSYNNILMYPNPSTGVTNIEFAGLLGDFNIRVFDLQGKVIRSTKVSVDGYLNKSFDFQNLSNGIYIVEIEGENQIFTEKLIIE